VTALKQKAAGEVISNRLMPAENFGAPASKRLSYRWAFSLFSSEAIQTRRVDV
jgi:hypothetical protein